MYNSNLCATCYPNTCVCTASKTKPVIMGNTTVFDKQVGGDHYKNMKIQPVDYIFANDLNFAEGCVVKYTTRSSYKRKAGDVNKAIQDLEKAIHYLEMQVELIKKDLK